MVFACWSAGMRFGNTVQEDHKQEAACQKVIQIQNLEILINYESETATYNLILEY